MSYTQGKECEMQQESVQTLKRCGRWWPVTAELSQVLGCRGLRLG